MVVTGSALAVWIAHAFLVQEAQLRAIRTEAALIEAQLATVRARNTQLKNEIVRLNSPEYLETVAREQLGLVKPGEVPYMVVRQPGQR